MSGTEDSPRSRWRTALNRTRYRNANYPNDISEEEAENLTAKEYSAFKGKYGNYLFGKYYQDHPEASVYEGDTDLNGSLTEFEPRPLRSLFSSKQPHLRILFINDKKHIRRRQTLLSKDKYYKPQPSSEIRNMSMNDLLDNLNQYFQNDLSISTHISKPVTSTRYSNSLHIPIISTLNKSAASSSGRSIDEKLNLQVPSTLVHPSNSSPMLNGTNFEASSPSVRNISKSSYNYSPEYDQFDRVHELRGRDLCSVVRQINAVDIPVVMIRQHACIFSLRFDVKAIVQAHRIIFIGRSSQDDFTGLKRHMNGTLSIIHNCLLMYLSINLSILQIIGYTA